MTTGSHIGKRIFVASAVPATNNPAGFEALTWVEALGWQTLPQFGTTNNNIDVPDAGTGFTKGLKGAGTGNDSTMTFRQIASDAGQVLIRQLAESGATSGAASFKVVKGSGAVTADGIPAVESGDPVEYAQGYLHGFVKTQGDNSTHEGFSVNFKQNAVTVDGTEPA